MLPFDDALRQLRAAVDAEEAARGAWTAAERRRVVALAEAVRALHAEKAAGRLTSDRLHILYWEHFERQPGDLAGVFGWRRARSTRSPALDCSP